MNAFVWTEKKAEAAVSLAQGDLTDEVIAEKAGVTRRMLAIWKQHPDFAARLSSHVEAFRQAVLTQGIADRVSRVRRQNNDWRSLQIVQQARAERAAFVAAGRRKEAAKEKPDLAALPLEYFDEYPGMITGLIVRVETPVKNGVKVEYQVDTGTLGELRALETQSAKELGQWAEKTELSGTVQVRPFAHLTLDELRSAINDGGNAPPEVSG